MGKVNTMAKTCGLFKVSPVSIVEENTCNYITVINYIQVTSHGIDLNLALYVNTLVTILYTCLKLGHFMVLSKTLI